MEIGSIVFTKHGVGFWGWGHGGTCYSYDISGATPSFDAAFLVSNGLSTVTVLLGGICMVCSWLGTCFPIFPRMYWYLGATFVLNGMLGMCTLAMLGSSACGPGFFSYATGTIDLETISTCSCGLGMGSVLALTGTFFSLLAAVTCLKSPLTHKDRVPKLTQKIEGGEELDENDPAKQLQRERELEAEKRYKEMFGDEDGDDDFDKAAAAAKLPKKLSLVEEGDNEEPSDHQQNKKAAISRSDSYDYDVEEFHDDDDPLMDSSHHAKTPNRKMSNKSFDDDERYDKVPNKGDPLGDDDHDDYDDDHDDVHDDYDDEMQSLADSEIV